MTTSSNRQHKPSAILERVRLHDNPQPGRYNARGEIDPKGNVFAVRIGPTAHVWAVFEKNLEPGQIAAMIFENVSGSGLLDSIISPWIKGGPGNLGQILNHPYLGDAAIKFLVRQRAKGSVKVIGQNSSQVTVSAAVGLLYIPGL